MEIRKNQPPPTFPGLGVPDNRRETPVVSGTELRNKKLLLGREAGDTREESLNNDVRGCVLANGPAVSFVDGTSKRVRATKQHEDFHQVMRRIENLHGQSTRHRLVDHLWLSMLANDRRHVEEHASSTYPKLNTLDTPIYREECLAELVGYQNGAKGRGAMSRERLRDRDQAMKRAWRAVQEAARTVHPGELGKSEPLEKRSKNVRERTRNLTDQQVRDRISRYATRLGFEVSPGPYDQFGTGRNGRGITYDRNQREIGGFGVGHELGHALQTPRGSKISDTQHLLGVPAVPGSYQRISQSAGSRHESLAAEMESLIRRRAGVSPDLNRADYEDSRKRKEEDIHERAKKIVEAWDVGRRRLTPRGRVAGHAFTVDDRINQRAAGSFPTILQSAADRGWRPRSLRTSTPPAKIPG